MAIHYLIDGYNLIYAWPDIPRGSWQEKRQVLLDFLKQQRPQGKNPATVVFDSREGSGNQRRENDITVVYTAGGTADDWISDQVRREPNPRSIVVVSNDKGIQHLIRGTGARFLSADQFLKTASSPRPPKNRTNDTSPEAAGEITDELKKKWLSKDGSS
jgi:predicted RNA-binding protein with PIN domain